MFSTILYMHYINAMPPAFENMADYINMYRAVLINEVFHELCDLPHHGSTWEAESAPHELIFQPYYGPDAGVNGFLLDSYIDELHKPRLIRFRRCYTIASEITRAGTPFREWDIVQLRNYDNGFFICSSQISVV